MYHRPMTTETAGSCLFDARLLPHRSLPRRGFALLMVALAIGLGAVGFGFWSLGAWPVAGFCGLEVLLVWGAFELNYRAARVHETVRLDDEALVVTRVDARGGVTAWRFEPGWVRVELERAGEENSRLVLSSHGRRLAVGAFLTPGERLEVAEALRHALARWRSPVGVRTLAERPFSE
jgi:uncharacterized membrane protein